MKYQELIILLPCHSLEDFPTYHEGEDADSLLASWSALWHPALLASAGAKPTWARVDSPPAVLTERLLVVPSLAVSQLPTGFAQRARDEGATLIRRLQRRDEIVAAALQPLDGGAGACDPELAADFLALGYCYLQIQLLTRQMRYSSNLDEIHFQNQLLAGARAAVAGETELAREKLSACFDMLSEERNHYYPVEACILDLTLVAETTLGASLRDELTRAPSANVVVSGGTLQRMAVAEPATLDALRQAVQQQRAALLGGEVVERRWPLLGLESLAAELRRGASVYEELAGRRPTVYARRRFGLGPALPLALQQAGFQGVLHATLDDGRFPQGSQLKVRWEGAGGASLDAIARVPLDASKPQTFLSFAMKLGESMDGDHVATLLLAHWPGQASVWYDDLRRIARYSGALGKFVTVDQYFRETDAPSQTDRFDAGQYRSPYLKQAIIRKQLDPLSAVMRYWKRRGQLESLQALQLLARVARGGPTSGQEEAVSQQLAAWAAEVDQRAEEPEPDLTQVQAFDAQLTAALEQAAGQLSESLPNAGAARGMAGLLVVNGASHARRCGIATTNLSAVPAVEKPVHAADEAQGQRHVVVDVPPLGYTWLAPAATPAAKPKRPVPPLAEDTILRNEFFEALLNPVTGSLQAIHEYQARGNRLSQQLALRLPGPGGGRAGEAYRDPDETAVYSVMAVDQIAVTASSTVLGEITTRGRLLDRHGQPQAKYIQIFRVWRGSRVLVIDIELEPLVEPQADPWNSYYACRFAWSNETAELYRTVHQQRQPVAGKQLEAPHYVDIVADPQRTTIFTGGLPFHRRVGLRMLDTLLVVRGERCRQFRVGIGIDVAHPLPEAQALVAPPLMVPRTAPPAPASSWLFHFDARNVTATHWAPLWSAGRMVGFETRVLETMGRSAAVKLSACRALVSACRVDLAGKVVAELPVAQGQAQLELAAHDWATVQARWE